MFCTFTTIPRRALIHSVRCLSQKPPLLPLSSSKQVKAIPLQKAGATRGLADSTLIQKPVEPIPISSVPTLDFSPPEHSEGAQRTGATSSKEYKTVSERTRRSRTRISLALLLLAFGANAAYMCREWEEEELRMKKMKLEDAPSTRWGRMKTRLTSIVDVFVEPAWPELLPPPYPPPYQKPYTLLLSVDDLLVTSQWDREHGWRTAKRPGVDYFLAYISQFYEVVIFTTQPGYTIDPILDQLDRYHLYLMYRLYREATRFVDGKIVKDLSYLNRDLSKVIMLDTDLDHVSTHPQNAVVLPKWKGDPKDKGLVAMIPFLESIAIYNPPDVRPILKAYEGKDVPLEYAKTEAKAKAKHIAEWNAKHKPSVTGPSFRNLFGLATTSEPPPTYLERKRQEAQKDYQLDRANIERQKDELERLLQEDQQAMAAQIPGNLWEAMDRFAGKTDDPAVVATAVSGSQKT
ncbi:HAD-like protein [Phlegmacium glaucopus]|nr:HAD-like protein [Phlegmacium glaucopus]